MSSDKHEEAKLRLLHLMDSQIEEMKALEPFVSSMDQQCARRILQRICFSGFEGELHCLKLLCLSYLEDEAAEMASPELVLALRSEQVDIKPSGVVYTKPGKFGLDKNLKLAVTTWAKIIQRESTLDLGSSGGQAFSRSVKVRDRITHPTDKADLLISDEEAKDMEDAFQWFHGLLTPLLLGVTVEDQSVEQVSAGNPLTAE